MALSTLRAPWFWRLTIAGSAHAGLIRSCACEYGELQVTRSSPPWIAIVWPVKLRDSSEARKTAVWAISSRRELAAALREQ